VVQTPVEQTCPAPQTVPHAPQLALSVVRLTHAPLQTEVPAGQAHAPLTQSAPVGHAWPHAPQLAADVCVLVSQPSAAVVLQSA
jgi:hypothetical protein